MTVFVNYVSEKFVLFILTFLGLFLEAFCLHLSLDCVESVVLCCLFQDVLQQVLQILLKTKLLISEGITETDIPAVLPEAAVISLFMTYKK